MLGIHGRSLSHLEVGLDFRTRRETMAPFRVQCEGVAVEVGRDIAGDAWVGILSPRPAQAIGLLIEDEVVEAGLPQLDCAEDPDIPAPMMMRRTGG
jgi:hypothetical protein